MGTQGHEAEVWEEIAARGDDIDHNVVIRYLGHRDVVGHAGLLLYHRHANGSVCGGGVTFAGTPGDGPRWTVVQGEPLTLSPSIQDKTCSEGLHGHIVDGRWVPC